MFEVGLRRGYGNDKVFTMFVRFLSALAFVARNEIVDILNHPSEPFRAMETRIGMK